MLQLLVYSVLFIFLTGVALKIIRLSNRIHLRCDLYPIPHIPKAHGGGGYYEEVEWWKRERKRSIYGVIKAILAILVINRRKMSLQPRHWLATFLFHLGIFLHVLWILLLILVIITFSTLSEGLAPILSVLGFTGLLLMFVFALYLLIRKLTRPIRYYVPLEDYIILSFVLAISSSGILALLEVDAHHSIEVLGSLIAFSEPSNLGFFETIHIATFSILIGILPFTRITHYIAVFFTHLALWDDRIRSEFDSRLEEIITSYRVKWGAGHLTSDLTWEENTRHLRF
ncbi:MAG: hypothetical protein V6S10_07665 [Candidatus Methanoglobus sp.]